MAEKKKNRTIVETGRNIYDAVRGKKRKKTSENGPAEVLNLSHLLNPSASQSDSALDRFLQALGDSAEKAERTASRKATKELHERIRWFGKALAGDESRKLRGQVLADLGNIARAAVRNKVPINRVGVYVGAGIAESLGDKVVNGDLFERVKSLGGRLPGIGAKASLKPSFASQAISSFGKGGVGRIAGGIAAAVAVPKVLNRVLERGTNQETIRRALASSPESVSEGTGTTETMRLLEGLIPGFEEMLVNDPERAMQFVHAYTPQPSAPARLPRGTIALSNQ